MPSLLFLQQNAILGVGPFLEDKVVLILLIVKVKTLSSWITPHKLPKTKSIFNIVLELTHSWLIII